MKNARRRSGSTNSFYLMAGAALLVVVLLGILLYQMNQQTARRAGDSSIVSGGNLVLFCASGLHEPVGKIIDEYGEECGVAVKAQYGGSGSLKGQLEVGEAADLYLAADDYFTDRAYEEGLIQERIPVGTMRLVMAVPEGNPKNIKSLDDLLRDDVRAVLCNPLQAASGRLTRQTLEEFGNWDAVKKQVTDTGVFKPTVTEVATDVKIGSVDVGIVWNTTVAQFDGVEAVRTDELDQAKANIVIAVVKGSRNGTAALKFARFLAARDRGLEHFAAAGFEPVDGDIWEETPQITFFAGSVNRKALDPIIEKFQAREGVVINIDYNGCGILTAKMRSIQEDQTAGFPDVYMACDVYYLEAVNEMFQDAVNVSNTDIVIVTQAGNPKNITSLEDLAKPGVRVVVGQPGQCTIGVLTKRLLEDAGLYDKIQPNIKSETTSSSLLVPAITAKGADAVLAYATDTLAEKNRLHIIPIDSPLAAAIQPFSIARSSDYKYLGRRLFATIEQSPEAFTSAGFVWRLDSPPPKDSPGKDEPTPEKSEQAPAEAESNKS